MTLSAGTQLGPFKITGSLGAGGMGEVYRATDTKLGREVAIKTLPSTLAADKDRLARFEREAKLLAALNHAHIATVHALDEHAGTRFVVMELIEGESLQAKLKGGSLPVEEALRLALQIAEALEAAHGKGVVHRDLKPANVMITRDGVVKVLDFGLAKAFVGDPKEASPAHSPALSVAMTQAGLVLGTAGYMSPEQASGQGTDQRTDIWAFGVVLYEMLTGMPLFRGESVPHILAAVLQLEPDWTRLPKNLHPRLKLLLERCLTKKPRKRYHSIADARVDIEAVLEAPEGPTPAIAVGALGPRSSSAWRRAGAVGVTAVVAGAAVWFLRPAPAPEPKPVVRFSIPLPAEQVLNFGVASVIALSPDGTRIAYVANNQLFLRNLGEREARPVPGTVSTGVGSAIPVFSPDGQWLAYIDAEGAQGPFFLKRVPISGGAPVTIYEARTPPDLPFAPTWPTPDAILFSNTAGVVRIPANGGATEVLIPRGDGEYFYSSQLLPGGTTVLFTRLNATPAPGTNFDSAQIAVQTIGVEDRTVVWDGGSAARYLPSGHLVYAQGTALFAIPFDPAARAVRGGPVPMLEGLRRTSAGFTDAANFAVSDTGTLVMIPGAANAVAQPSIGATLTWVDRDGREEPLPIRPDDYTAARVSPDGTKIALVVGALLSRGTAAIWIYDRRTENLSLLAAPESDAAPRPGGDTGPVAIGDEGPVWSSDGSRIFFRSYRAESTPGVYAIDVATGETTLIATAAPDFPNPLPWSLSPDDRTLAIVTAAVAENLNVATLSLADGQFARLLDTDAHESEPAISPNGAWLAYAGIAEDPASEINIRPFPGVSRTRIPVGSGRLPVFSQDGSELFYYDGRGLAVVPITYEPTLRVGAPHRLFESATYMWSATGRAWDVDPTGERFLMIRFPGAGTPPADGDSKPTRIDVVLNWVEELKSRVPVE